MALVNRISRLFTADMHAVLDRIEEPELLLRQAIREMEEELGRSERALAQLAHERDRLTRRQAQLRSALPDLDEQINVCFDTGQEQLARKIIKRKLEAERMTGHLKDRCETVETALIEGREKMKEQREQLESTKQKAELLTERAREHAAGEYAADSLFDGVALSISDDEVEAAFLREQARRKSQ